MSWKVVVELVSRLIKGAIKPAMTLLALLAARRFGRLQSEKEALHEQAEQIEKASRARADSEFDGVRNEDYRD